MSCSAVSSKSLEDHLLDVPCPPSHVSNQMFREYAKLQNLTDFEIDCITRKCGSEGTTSIVSRTLPVSTVSLVSSTMATGTSIPISPIQASETAFLVFVMLSIVLLVYTIISVLIFVRIWQWKRRRQKEYMPNTVDMDEDTSALTLQYIKKRKSQRLDMIQTEEETSFLTYPSQEKRISQTIVPDFVISDVHKSNLDEKQHNAASHLDPDSLKS